MKSSPNNPGFSIIIPSYNEGEDIRLAIESAINQDYPVAEILVVDDSSDETPTLIKEYQKNGVMLVKGEGKGCCGARNLGMRQAKGDIVVLLNADVSLPRDFVRKIKKHYDAGADYVLVESKVSNQENFWARFIEMQHRWDSWTLGETAEWTEGFSCRRQAALGVGLIPGDFNLRFCRDWFLGKNLGKAGYKKVIDRSIIVSHKSPDTFREYWRVRKARGRFGALTQYFLQERTFFYLGIKFFIKDMVMALKFLTVLPALWKVAVIDSYSDRKIRNFFLYLYTYFFQELARAVGEWEGLAVILNSNKTRN